MPLLEGADGLQVADESSQIARVPVYQRLQRLRVHAPVLSVEDPVGNPSEVQFPRPVEVHQFGLPEQPVTVPLPASVPAPEPHWVITGHDDGLLRYFEQIE